MRDWDRASDDVLAAGAQLLVLSPDAPRVLQDAVRLKGLKAAFSPVDPELWGQWGLTNPKRPNLPHPSTLVVGPDGTLLLRETHVNYRTRAGVSEVLAFIARHRDSGEAGEGGQSASGEAGQTSRGAETSARATDWDRAVSLTVSRERKELTVELTITPGFHVYGTLEETGRPLAVRVTGQPQATALVPEGRSKELGTLGVSHVLDGVVRLPVTLTRDGPAEGELDLQLCTESLCSRPQTRSWSSP